MKQINTTFNKNDLVHSKIKVVNYIPRTQYVDVQQRISANPLCSGLVGKQTY